MLIRLDPDAPKSTLEGCRRAASMAEVVIRELHFSDGQVVVAAEREIEIDLSCFPGVAQVVRVHKPYMLASLEARGPSTVAVGAVQIGSGDPVVIAGPCVVENREQLIEAAIAVKAAGATILRGGAYKPRTSPYSFQGLGELGLQHLAAARNITGLPVVTEALEPDQVDLIAEYADMVQIGTRNMSNFPLLKKAGRCGKPVMLKRGFAATIEEWLMSAEYILAAGNPNVVLCERGIRGFDTATRFNLDLAAVPVVKELTHLPVIVDPSHGTGRRSLVKPMALAALAAGADGLIIEAQPNPETALCDSSQMIDPDELGEIVRIGKAMLQAISPVVA